MTSDNFAHQKSKLALDTLCWLIEECFEVGDQSLMANLTDLRDEDWTALPPTGERTIADILEHVGWCKWMYADYAFGTASLRGDQPPLIPPGGARSRPKDELLAWLRAGQDHWLACVHALIEDSELEVERMTNWGETLPTRTILLIMIEHDVYHAGEINHLRALLQGNDRWEYA